MLSFFGFKRRPQQKATAKRAPQPSQQRSAVRLDVIVPGLWRFASNGRAFGEYSRGSITDISRTGASLTVDREVQAGAQVELKLTVSSSAVPLVLVGEVMRAASVAASGKSKLGLRFLGVTPEDDRKIMEFINKRQAERRSRGLA